MLFCCFIYHGGLQSRSVTYVKPSSVFIAWGRTLAEPFPLGQAQSAFLPRSHVPGPYYRAEYGYRRKDKKKPLTTAPGRNPGVNTKGRGMSKRLQLVASYGNGADSSLLSQPCQH